jgi:MoxR-like ATPase
MNEAWNFIKKPDKRKAIFDIEPEAWELLKDIILKTNTDLQPAALAIEKAEKDREKIYNLDVNAITNKVVVSPITIQEIETHLKSGRNIVLYGPQGSGKELLANLVAEQVCGKRIESKGHDLYNYTVKMTNPLWEEDDLVGYWEDEADKKSYRKGFGTLVVEWCAESMRNSDKPHYLILNKMERIDLDRAFNRFLSLTSDKETSVLLSHLKGETITLKVPKEFRIIGTANCEGWAIPDNLVPLKGQFSFIEVGMPEKRLEYEKIPFLVRERQLYHGIISNEELINKEFQKMEKGISRFDNDPEGEIQNMYDMLMDFFSKDKFPPKGTVIPRGVRTYKAIGTQLLVETMVCVANTPLKTDRKTALENAVMSIFLPLLEEMEPKELYNVQLKAKEIFGMRSKIVEMLQTLIGKQAGSLDLDGENGDMKIDDWADEGEMDDYYISAEDVNKVEVLYDIDLAPIFDHLSISKKTLNQILVNLESGRNIILYGAPGCGKTKVATLLCEQLCGRVTNEEGESKPNFTIITANAEWDNYDIVGGVAPKVDEYTHEISYEFRDGCVTGAVKECLKSLKKIAKPHLLIIDEFNRANIDEAFGKLFTIFEYRDTQPLLTKEENKGNALYVPNQFRIIGTMNVQDKNTLFDIGHALMRRYAFIEVGLPDKEDEFNRMPHFIELRSKEMGITLKGEKTAKSMFRGDLDGRAEAEYRKLMRFLEEEKMPEEGIEVPVGIRTYRKIGTAQVIDCVIWILKSSGDYSKEEAMQDAVIANILPQLENLEKAHLSNIYLKAVNVFGERSRLAHAVDRMRKSTTLSIFG